MCCVLGHIRCGMGFLNIWSRRGDRMGHGVMYSVYVSIVCVGIIYQGCMGQALWEGYGGLT